VEKQYDVVLYGATGFTGQQAAAWFQKHAPVGLRWAVAGRRAEALGEVASRTGADGVIVADSTDIDSVAKMVATTRVLLTTAGPYFKYGDPVVDACASQGVHYVDITGETPWVADIIERLHEVATKNSTRIVPFCGFDSIPSDLGVLLLANEMRSRFGVGVRSIFGSFKLRGGLNGGTLDSALTMADLGVNRRLGNPLLLNPRSHRTEEEKRRSRDFRSITYDGVRECWLAPFVMAMINTRVVRRSNALRDVYGDGAYGAEFSYDEAMEFRSRFQATQIALSLLALEKSLRSSVTRSLIRKFGPSPGKGPSEAVMDGGFMRVRHVGVADDGRKLMLTIKSDGDPGNRITVALLCESALLLATSAPEDLPGGASRGGVLTPATALGMSLRPRLESVGFSFEFSEL
jgi:short subunit dehydrogenase-like uncharacterized protein